MKVITYTGLGRALARLHAIALRTVIYDNAISLNPIEFVEHFSVYLEPDEIIIYALGDLNDALRVVDAARLAGWKLEIITVKDLVNDNLKRKMEPYIIKSIESDEVLNALLEGYDFMVRHVLNMGKSFRIKRLMEEIKDPEGAEQWAQEHIQIPDSFEIISYTPSMELAAVAAGILLEKPVMELGSDRLDVPTEDVLLFTTSAEEHWTRKFAVRGAKRVVVNTDPITAPWYVLLKLKALTRSSGKRVCID